MGFFEAVFAITAVMAVFVGMPWITFQGILKVKQANAEGSSTELRRSDLEAMVADAVEDATHPLRRRIETLEAIATDTEAEQSRLDSAVLADALVGLEDDFDEPAAVRRRARS